jgi:hypothetical protein
MQVIRTPFPVRGVDRTVAVSPIDVLQPAVSNDGHKLILMPACLAPRHDRFDLREDDRPDFRPAIFALLPQGPRMLALTEARPVSVVIKLDKVFAPPQEHRVARVQQGIYSVQQYLRPSINRAYRGLAPIERTGQIGHLADPEKFTRSSVHSGGKRSIVFLFRGHRHTGSFGRSGGVPRKSMSIEPGTPSRWDFCLARRQVVPDPRFVIRRNCRAANLFFHGEERWVGLEKIRSKGLLSK